MLNELINPNNIISFNCSLAQKIGLHETLYLTEFYKQLDYCQEPEIIPNNSIINLHTTLTNKEQEKAKNVLLQMGILEFNNIDNTYKVNEAVLVGLFTTEDKEVLVDFNKVKKSAKKTDKSEYILKSVKSKINKDYPFIVKEALSNWLDAIHGRFGFVNNAMLVSAMKLLDPIIRNNPETAIEIIEICTVNGYKEIQWGINKYNNLQKVEANSHISSTINKVQQELSTDYF